MKYGQREKEMYEILDAGRKLLVFTHYKFTKKLYFDRCFKVPIYRDNLSVITSHARDMLYRIIFND